MQFHNGKVGLVPTNIITGFLGVGKTTLILNLLKHKPPQQTWAVLVNEFGEVGVDGSLLQGQHGEGSGIFVREVPGGCMCCAAGLPMQIALNQLLARANPDRLLIEPTGLGHPKEVLGVLIAEHYRHVLDVQQCITLVDARKIGDARYTEHDTFNQQIDIADTIIGHKADLCDAKARQALMEYVRRRRGRSTPIRFVEQGNVETTILDGASTAATNLERHQNHTHSSAPAPSIDEQTIPECGFLLVENQGEGFKSFGWRFAPNKVFDRLALFDWLSGLRVERAKGVFITSDGVFGYNLTLETMTEMELGECNESRIEIIVRDRDTLDHQGLLECFDH